MPLPRALLLLAVLPLAACAAPPADDGAHPANAELPAPVRMKRDAILAAAAENDLRALAALGGPHFKYSFGVAEDPVAYWRLEEEAGGRRVGDILAVLLNMRPAQAGDGYVWPWQASADWDGLDAADKQALLPLHGEDELRVFDQVGGYIGWRTRISRQGEWEVFIAGD